MPSSWSCGPAVGHSQSGFSLIEVALALVVSMMALVIAVQWAQRQGEETRVIQKAQELSMVGDAVDAYVRANLTALLADSPVILIKGQVQTTVHNPLQPSMAELIAGGYLSEGYLNNSTFASRYVIDLKRNGSVAGTACGQTGGTCAMINSLVVMTTPITAENSSSYSTSLLAIAANVIGPAAGWSDDNTPQVIRGVSGWTELNPVQPVKAGLLARNAQISMANANAAVNSTACTCGDIKASISKQAVQPPWYVMDGQTTLPVNTCSQFLNLTVTPNVSERYLAQQASLSVGVAYGNSLLADANLPTFKSSGSTTKDDTYSPHRHNIVIGMSNYACGWDANCNPNPAYAIHGMSSATSPGVFLGNTSNDGVHSHQVDVTHTNMNQTAFTPNSFSVKYLLCVN